MKTYVTIQLRLNDMKAGRQRAKVLDMLNHHLNAALIRATDRPRAPRRHRRPARAQDVPAKASGISSLFGTSRPIRAMSAQKLGSSG